MLVHLSAGEGGGRQRLLRARHPAGRPRRFRARFVPRRCLERTSAAARRPAGGRANAVRARRRSAGWRVAYALPRRAACTAATKRTRGTMSLVSINGACVRRERPAPSTSRAAAHKLAATRSSFAALRSPGDALARRRARRGSPALPGRGAPPQALHTPPRPLRGHVLRAEVPRAWRPPRGSRRARGLLRAPRAGTHPRCGVRRQQAADAPRAFPGAVYDITNTPNSHANEAIKTLNRFTRDTFGLGGIFHGAVEIGGEGAPPAQRPVVNQLGLLHAAQLCAAACLAGLHCCGRP
jgi:hypothetical protein